MTEAEVSTNEWRGGLLLVSSFAVALLIIIANILPFLGPSGWWPSLDLAFPLSLINFAVLPFVFLVLAYRVFVIRTSYGYPTTRNDVLDQLAFVVLLCPGAMLAEMVIVYLVTYGWSLIRPVSEGGWSLTGVGWSFVLLFPATAISVLVGLPLVIGSVYAVIRLSARTRH